MFVYARWLASRLLYLYAPPSALLRLHGSRLLSVYCGYALYDLGVLRAGKYDEYGGATLAQ